MNECRSCRCSSGHFLWPPPIRWDVCLHYFRVISPFESSGCPGIQGAPRLTHRIWCPSRWIISRTGQVPTTSSTCSRSTARSGTCSSPRTSSPERAEALPSSGSNLQLWWKIFIWWTRQLRFYDKRDAEDAMDALDGRMYDGRDLRIQMAKYGRPEPSERWPISDIICGA